METPTPPPKPKLFVVFIVVVIAAVLNSIFFEYCISRDTPVFIQLLIALIIIPVDIFVFVNVVTAIKKILKL